MVRVVRFPFEVAERRVQAARLDEVGSCIQTQRIDPELAGFQFQFLHEQAPHSLAS